MKIVVFIFCICFLFSSCDVFTDKNGSETEPPYKAKIAWDSGIYSNFFLSHTVGGNSVYFYARPDGYPDADLYQLTKLNAEDGGLIWQAGIFDAIVYCQPIITGGYVYVFLQPNIIECYDIKYGEHTATVKVETDMENKGSNIDDNVTLYQQHLYFGLWNNTGDYFVRLNINDIKHGEPDTIQTLVSEELWAPEKGIVEARPVVHNNVIYTSTSQTSYLTPVELAGFDINTKQMVFYQTFGGPEDANARFPETGGKDDPILIHEDILYYLSWSINAWDLKTGERLYRQVFSWDVPEPFNYTPSDLIIQPVYYQDKIYYISRTSYHPSRPKSFRSIHCIDAATGELDWNDISKGDPFTLYTNPVIAHDRLYMAQFSGLRVYDPETGKLIGVDKSFCGANWGRNILYNDYMICLRKNPEEPGGRMVAVNVGK
jgi:outer membrane protein assembly factor BamB